MKTISDDSKKIRTKLETIFTECQSEIRVPEELRQLLTEKNNRNNEVAASEILDYFYEKYDQKSWIIVVYDDVSGFDKHTLSGFILSS